LIGKPDKIQKLLERTARPIFIPFGVTPCGRDNFSSVPNNFFGSGELDIEAAIDLCINNSSDSEFSADEPIKKSGHGHENVTVSFVKNDSQLSHEN
jgi:hypothetical protein